MFFRAIFFSDDSHSNEEMNSDNENRDKIQKLHRDLSENKTAADAFYFRHFLIQGEKNKSIMLQQQYNNTIYFVKIAKI